MLVAFVAIAANAEKETHNYKVTITTLRQVEFISVKDNSTVSSFSEPGTKMEFFIPAETKYMAMEEALRRCQGACRSGIPQLEQKNVQKNGVLCNRYATIIPNEPDAQEVK